MNVLEFTRTLPSEWATCAIYRKGQEITVKRGDEEAIEIACGKRPIGHTHHRRVSPAQTANVLERNPETFGAVGVFTGPRSGGVVCLDIDQNLPILRKDWEGDLEGFRVFSPTKNAGKWFFTVPGDQWLEVEDVSRAATGRGFEVLWGRQAVLCGAYPDGGEYVPHGDPNDLPVAPEWLLGLMRDSYHLKRSQEKNKGVVSSRYSMRSKEETIAIAQSCLWVVKPQGGGEDLWWRVGAMLHSELPGEDGLELWRTWSKRDPEYSDVWANDEDPCAARWANFKDKGIKGLGFGSLVKLADELDPERARFRKDGVDKIIEEIEAATISFRKEFLAFDLFYERAEEIFTDLEMSVGERRYKLLSLANDCGIKQHPVQEVTEMYLSERESRSTTKKDRTATDRWDSPMAASYYVPGLLCSGVWLLSGKGGDGKTNAAWAFAKHFLKGKPLKSPEGQLSWEKGNVLWLSGDQPDPVMDDQIRTHLDREDCEGLHVESNFNINDYPGFMTLANRHKPKLVVIDSLRSTHRGTGVSENDSEFALPLRWYEQMMGQPDMFESCMILVIHHSGHSRAGARGSSAIGDMTSFVTNFSVPSDKSSFNPVNQRLINFQKHRFGLKDHCIVCTLEQDQTVSLKYVGATGENSATTIQDRIRMRLSRSPGRSYTVEELAACSIIDGSKEAVKKALQRLKRQGQAEPRGKRDRRTLWGSAGVVAGSFLGGPVVDVPVSEDTDDSPDPTGTLSISVSDTHLVQTPSPAMEVERDDELSRSEIVPLQSSSDVSDEERQAAIDRWKI